MHSIQHIPHLRQSIKQCRVLYRVSTRQAHTPIEYLPSRLLPFGVLLLFFRLCPMILINIIEQTTRAPLNIYTQLAGEKM